MAKLFLVDLNRVADEYEDYPRERIERSYANDAHGVHELVDDPAVADAILYAINHKFQPAGLSLLADPVFRKFPRKALLHDSGDFPSPLLGGLCAGWHDGLSSYPNMSLGWSYAHPGSAEPTLEKLAWDDNATYLWSFKGSVVTHPIRRVLMNVNDGRGHFIDTTDTSQINLRKNSAPSDPAKRSFLGD
ncbi:hypothetical protein [Neolewinella antarctica]|uniref:Uncharacterized protein n=1 Tax=Neolewinella antarctica TaxID=442734 RepID=A0ABX0XF58_9BACT|nr:hypothetical protein [Neolewinella antarctica]NJC27871.1 hypothetical protein [Neolewinella antarctica]